MTPLRKLSIQRKLWVLLCAATALALLCVLGAVVVYESRTFRPRAQDRLQRPANIIGEVIQSALDFGDPEAARRYLQKCCEAQEEIVLAVVYDSSGVVFATYQRAGDSSAVPATVAPAGFEFRARELTLWQPILRKDQVLGQLYMVEKLPPLLARLPQYSIMTGAVIIALVVVGGVLLFGVRRNFLRPLASLVETTTRVTQLNDYSIRATSRREDELGRLAQAFNQMLEVIGQRDAALRHASEQIQNVFNAATEVLIIATDTKGLVTLFNTGAERSLGYTAGEIVGQQTPVIWHVAEEVAARAAELSKIYDKRIEGFDTFVELARRGHYDAREWTFVRKGGGHLTVLLVVTAIRDAKGGITGFLGVGNDITVRTAAESALRESEHKFRTLVEQSTDGIFITNAQGCFVDINSTGALLLGCPYQDVLRLHLRDIVMEGEASRITSQLVPLYQGVTTRNEWTIKRRDGTWFDGEVTAKILPDGRILGILRDITDRRRAEEELRQREERFRSLIENASDMITVMNHEAVIRYQSPSAERILGYSPDEMIGQSAFSYVHPDDMAKTREALGRAMQQPGVLVTLAVRLKHRDGSWRLIEAIGRNIRYDRAERQIVLNSRDITQASKLEEQLRQSQKMEAIGQLSGGVAHDFNNILTVVQMHLAQFESHPALPADLKEPVLEIKQFTERASNLTRQLLAFSRRQTIQLRVLDLNEVTSHLTRMLQRILGEDIRMQLHYSPHPTTVYADAGMMEQVLLNLVVNARDAMPKGGRLIVETSLVELTESQAAQSPLARAGTFVCLSVSDSGCGIPADVLPKIFEPFFTTKDVGKGTGLGLATVYGIVQQHEGWINTYSEVGKGTTFRIHLPRIAQVTSPAPGKPTLASVRGGAETILLVEDEPALRKLGINLLKRLGYTVLDAPTAVVALEIWKSQRDQINLLLTDLVMPDGMSGQELAAQLLQDRPQLPVIYTSGYSAEIAGKDFPLKEGVNFLAKPFNPVTLGEVVRQSLDNLPGASV